MWFVVVHPTQLQHATIFGPIYNGSVAAKTV